MLGWFAPGGLKTEHHGFPYREVDLFKPTIARPAGMLFVGMRAERRANLPGWKFRPLYLSDKDRSEHQHVFGRTGSGKTTSVLWPQVLQDAVEQMDFA